MFPVNTRRATVLAAAAAVLAATSFSPASAADLGGASFKDEADAPRILWRGFYGGVHAGGVMDGESEFDFEPGVGVSGDTNSIDYNGGIAGGQIGYNAQWGPVVVGVEGDLSFGPSSNATGCVYLGGTCSTQTDGLGSIRGRLGATLTPSFLFYGTGGIAFASVEHSVDFGGQLFEDDSLVEGAVYGGGVEYMHRSGISFGVEYLLYDFEQEKYDLVDFNGNEIPTDVDMDASVVRARVNLHFN